MGKIRSKTCEGRELTKDQLGRSLSRALADLLSHRYTLLKYLALAYAQRFTSNWIQAQMDNLTSGGASLGDTIM